MLIPIDPILKRTKTLLRADQKPGSSVKKLYENYHAHLLKKRTQDLNKIAIERW